MVLNDATLLSICASGIAFFALIAKLIYSSKCKKVSCCRGFIEIIRDTDNETSTRNITSTV